MHPPCLGGGRIPGSPVTCRCVLCHEDNCHHAIRCIQCMNAPGCCRCIWDNMRSRYNSGCPLCRHGDSCGENPLGENQKRQQPVRREELVRVLHRRGRGRRGGILVCGIGRGRGRGQQSQQQEQQQEESGGPVRGSGNSNRARRGRRGGRGRAKGRGTTIEDEEKN